MPDTDRVVRQFCDKAGTDTVHHDVNVIDSLAFMSSVKTKVHKVYRE